MFPKTASVIFPVVLVCCVFLTAGVAIAQPPTVVIVVDDSGSMRDRMRIPDGNGGTKRVRRMDVAKDALRDVLNNLPDETIVGLLALNSETDTDNTSIPNSDPMREHWIIPVGPLDKSKLRSRINKIRANGGTPLGAALKSASDELIRRRWENVYGEYRMLIVTDGEANDNDKLNSNLPSALGRGLVVDVIGVDMKSQHSLATRVHRYRSAADPESLQLAMREVFAEADTAVDEDVTVVANASGDEGETEEQRPPNDFEMIEGLPDEIAIAAIESLSKRTDAPLEPTDWKTVNAFQSLPGNDGNTGNVPNENDAAVAFRSLFSGCLCCGFSFVFLLFGALVLKIIVGKRN